MAKVIIFGVQANSSLAHFYLRNDSSHEVVAFSVTKEYLPESMNFEGLPVVDFESVEKLYPPNEFSFFAPLSPRKMNVLRKEVYEHILLKGYDMVSYISSKAVTFSNVKIGKNCLILENNTIQPFVTIGDNVILWSGNHIGHHSIIEDHVFLTSHVVLSGHCRVKQKAYLGVNCTIRDGLIIEEGCFVAMGSVLQTTTTPDSIYQGNPAEKSRVPASRFFK